MTLTPPEVKEMVPPIGLARKMIRLIPKMGMLIACGIGHNFDTDLPPYSCLHKENQAHTNSIMKVSLLKPVLTALTMQNPTWNSTNHMLFDCSCCS